MTRYLPHWHDADGWIDENRTEHPRTVVDIWRSWPAEHRTEAYATWDTDQQEAFTRDWEAFYEGFDPHAPADVELTFTAATYPTYADVLDAWLSGRMNDQDARDAGYDPADLTTSLSTDLGADATAATAVFGDDDTDEL